MGLKRKMIIRPSFILEVERATVLDPAPSLRFYEIDTLVKMTIERPVQIDQSQR